MRAIIVLGPNRSGTSCCSQILHNLGVPMTATKFFDITYEDMELRTIMHLFGRLKKKGGPSEKLNGWIRSRIDAAKYIWGAKHPKLCLCGVGDVVLNSVKFHISDIKIIAMHRPKTDSAKSRQITMRNVKIDGPLRYINKMLQDRRKILHAWEGPVMHIGYYKILDGPRKQIEKIIDFCFEDLPRPNESQIKKAVNGIDPELRHVHNCEIVPETKPWRGFNPGKRQMSRKGKA